MLANENSNETCFPLFKKLGGLGRLVSLQSNLNPVGASSYAECQTNKAFWGWFMALGLWRWVYGKIETDHQLSYIYS